MSSDGIETRFFPAFAQVRRQPSDVVVCLSILARAINSNCEEQQTLELQNEKVSWAPDVHRHQPGKCRPNNWGTSEEEMLSWLWNSSFVHTSRTYTAGS